MNKLKNIFSFSIWWLVIVLVAANMLLLTTSMSLADQANNTGKKTQQLVEQNRQLALTLEEKNRLSILETFASDWGFTEKLLPLSLTSNNLASKILLPAFQP